MQVEKPSDRRDGKIFGGLVKSKALLCQHLQHCQQDYSLSNCLMECV